ncbi:hypothetical protein P5673_025383 [Acropora cervicornis]|uniref:Uncharacterized protein n=1 Tax=Acropora cervicornis TaxID=6130 RepID=A0AAD9UX28_ACRCE|nr:hypothetical protein P5673_025383 [Acropora cervicornis]
MSLRLFWIVILISLAFLTLNEVNAIHFFKRLQANQFKRRSWKESSDTNSWCSVACDSPCRIVDAAGRFDITYHDCDCGVHCHCVYSVTRNNAYYYRCTPI